MTYINNKNVITVTATGFDASYIVDANLAGFYGIFGNTTHAAAGRRAAYRIVDAYIAENNINVTDYDVLAARTVNTDGTPVPYKVEIDVRLNVA